MRFLLVAAMTVACVVSHGTASSASLRHGAMQADADEAGPTSPKPLSPAEKQYILDRLRARKEAIKRLALEDALGD